MKCTELNIVGRVEALCRNEVSFVKESLESFEYDRCFVLVRARIADCYSSSSYRFPANGVARWSWLAEYRADG